MVKLTLKILQQMMAQVFSCELCEILNSFFTELLQMTDSE